MGLTCHWTGIGTDADHADWRVDAARGIPPIDPEFPMWDEPGMHFACVGALRQLVISTRSPAFAAYGYDDDFAFLCVGAEQAVQGEVLFDPDAVEAYRVPIETKPLVRDGPGKLSAWAERYAPYCVGPAVVSVIVEEGGGPYGVMTLMRVLGIELPYPPPRLPARGSDA